MYQSRTVGIVAAIIAHILLLILLFVWGLRVPYPPPPEEGILINFGTSATGSGIAEPFRRERQHPTQSPANPESDLAQPTLTQDYEDAPAINERKQKKRTRKESPNPPVPTQEEAKEPPRTVNRDALFSRGQNADADNRSHGEGNDGSPSQNQGAKDGGVMQGYGTGSSVSLKGRSLVDVLPAPKYDVQVEGRVVVKIKVDRNGKVVEALAQQSGSTLINSTLYAAAEQAALRAKFTPAAGDAPPHQSGSIVYVFKMGGK
jgi:TonB family protein